MKWFVLALAIINVALGWQKHNYISAGNFVAAGFCTCAFFIGIMDKWLKRKMEV